MDFWPPRQHDCTACGSPATVAYGYGLSTSYGCDAHNPMRFTGAASPAGFWLRSLAPLPLAAPHATGHPGLAPLASLWQATPSSSPM